MTLALLIYRRDDGAVRQHEWPNADVPWPQEIDTPSGHWTFQTCIGRFTRDTITTDEIRARTARTEAR